jgi:uncharacterized protein YjbI with pentapeptide repeats
MSGFSFSDAEIQNKVKAIRQARGGIGGGPQADWQEAVRQLEQEAIEKAEQAEAVRQSEQATIEQTKQKTSASNRRHSLSSRLLSLPMLVEKKAIEPTANWLDEADIFRIIEKISPIIEAIGVIAIPVAIWWFTETSQEAKDQQERAVRAQNAVQSYLNQLSDVLATGKLKTDEELQTIIRASTLALLKNPDLQPDPRLSRNENLRNDRKGQTIRYLVEAGLVQGKLVEEQNTDQESDRKRPVISLVKADLTNADLGGASLNGAGLSFANLSFANLTLADLSRADLIDADLISANLKDADLSFANLNIADLSNASLDSTNFTFANLTLANLNGADLSFANLDGANLELVGLVGANLRFAKLRNANLKRTDFEGANLSNADLSDAKNWTERQINRAKLCKTKLPQGLTLNPNRDC